MKLLPVRAPFRLDLTADALRRLASNAVDVVASDGTLYRALRDEGGSTVVAIRPHDGRRIEVQTTDDDDRWLPVVERMLGTRVDLSEWYARSAGVPWLAPIATALRGLKPPRYPSLWEACAHAILFQQISIHAAAAIMRRAVEALGETIEAGGVRCIAFPGPERWHAAGDATLSAAGLSQNKRAHIRSAAAAFLEGSLDERRLEGLPSEKAAAELCGIRGIGAWSAAVMLLRGMGRLDVFPLRDSGVARTLGVLSGCADLDERELLDRLGPVRGMLYYHLLLGRLRNLVPS